MAQQPAPNQSTPLLAPDPLHPTMEQRVEGSEPRTISTSLGSNTVIQPSNEAYPLSSPISSHLCSTLQPDHEDENMPLLLSASKHSTLEQQQHEGHEHNSGAIFNSPRVHDESTQGFFSGTLHSGTEQQNKHSPSSHSTSGELSPIIWLQVRDDSTSNTFAQQVEVQRPFLLSDPTKSSIMLRRSADAESAPTARSSTSHESLQNLNPERVKKLISPLGLDNQQAEMMCKLVIATAPFHDNGSLPPPGESDPKIDAVRASLDSLLFAPKKADPINSPIATTAEEGSIAGNNNKKPTGTLLLDANAAENLGSCPLEQRPDSPPLLWSTAAAEESLDPNAEDPTYYTVAEFINTIIDNNIQLESVTEEDWAIEKLRVAILNRLKEDISEEALTAEGDFNEEVVTKVDDNELVETQEEAIEKVQAREDTSESDLRRWMAQDPEDALTRADGTCMSAEEIDEECDRWDAMVRKARNEKEAEKTVPLLGPKIDLKDKAFWEYMRSSKQKESTQGAISTRDQEEKGSVSAHDQVDKVDQKKKKKKKGSKKNKHNNRKGKKNASKGGDSQDMPEDMPNTQTFSYFLDLPSQAIHNVLGYVLVVQQDLVPYHYVKGKIVKNIGLREKPELNILLALCSSKDKTVKKCLDDAKNILYRENIFAIRKPNDLIMFLGTIGGDNVARMKMGKNLLLTDTFFDKKRRYVLEMNWLARWGEELLWHLQGNNIFRADIAADSSDDGLTCEPTDIEKALKSMIEVMKDEGKMYKMLEENGHGSGGSPMRIQSLDFGEKFDVLTEQIKTMGLVIGDGNVTMPDTAKMSETDVSERHVESMTGMWKRKAGEARQEVIDDRDPNAYGQLFLEVLSFLDEDNDDDVSSQSSGFYTP